MTTIRHIRHYAKRLAREFRPRRIILFGSYASGKATEDSDVDLLVLMDRVPKADETAIQMRLRIPRTFPMDLLVKKTADARKRAEQGDSFLREILNEGLVVYEQRDR